MKIISVITLVTISLCAGLCCTEPEDYDYNLTSIENDNIIQIENNQNVFNVDDTIYIETLIENQQTTTDNQDILLSDLIDVQNTNNFLYYYLSLYKETSYGTLSKIELTPENIDIIDGNATIENQEIFIQNLYNGTAFKNKIGIKLLETGTFYLTGVSYNYNNSGLVNIRSISNQGGDILISTSIINSNENSAYQFTVN